MYLAELKLWNFRKYGIKGDSFDSAEPGLKIEFRKGVNVLIGENDSGKTAIIDAIRYVLKTQSQEFIQIEEKDFYKSGNNRATELKIECTFSGFNSADAGHFLEWIGFDENNKYKLKVWLIAKRKDNSIYPRISAGADLEGAYMEGEARDLLRVIYLKPLRDALSEMTHGRKSRLAQILKSLEAFKDIPDETGKRKNHDLENYQKSYGKKVNKYFKKDKQGKLIRKTINEFLTEDFLFRGEDRKAAIKIEDSELSEILRDLDLVLEENKSGLGSLNLLCMAAELLHLKEKVTGLKLTLIEELEAHLHPQYQLTVIDFIERNQKKYGQFILTTHSTTLASKIDLEKLIICQKSSGVFPMGHNYTQLEKGDYQFLQRFLDATKANLFFARGVIIVEGDAENLIIPTLANIIERPLHAYGVSIVNVGSTAFKRYAKIFLRKDKDEEPNEWLDIPVSVITDTDIRSIEYYEDKGKDLKGRTRESIEDERSSKIEQVKDLMNKQNITAHLPLRWTLEYDIALSSLSPFLKKAISIARELKKNENKVYSKKKIKKISTEIEIEDKLSEKEAYNLFKPLNNGSVSKAITAQILAALLEETDTDLKSLITEDSYLGYICDAIYHVTEPNEEVEE